MEIEPDWKKCGESATDPAGRAKRANHAMTIMNSTELALVGFHLGVAEAVRGKPTHLYRRIERAARVPR